ncbi:MAG: DNA-binding protein [Deltaproteobacteria bacterium]|nr:DNA-binding protein [Deltaproteobacteria bacterium]
MNITPEIERRIASFVADLDGLVRTAALEAVRAALGGKAPVAKAPAAATTKAPKAAPAVKSASTKASAPKAQRKGGKRDPQDLAKLVDAVAAHIAKNSGQGVETIAKYLGVSTKELALPIIKLLDAKKITRKGQRRGTRYFLAK